ncbi:MAG: dienelactone hydrolase family protein [Gammaproteobacteria bacterium]|nr:dienelactone hydrolase family protein [Gammaproteobacteria bacterium]
MPVTPNILQKITLELKNNKPAQFSVIWLHGLGADGNDFVPIVPELKVQDQLNIRFIFPNANIMPVTINNNYSMPAWFDIYSFDKNGREDNQGIEKTRQLINQLITEEYNKGVPYENIALAGFSQGGVIALYTALKFEHRLAGVLGLSCYLPRFDKNYNLANKNIKIFLAHGTQDSIVSYEYGQSAYNRLKELNYHTKLHSYPMGHTVCLSEITDIANFLKEIFIAAGL